MTLGALSESRLGTCHQALQQLIRAASKGVDEGDLAYAGIRDMTVLCGFRGQAEQDDALARGTSEKPWPLSHHNRMPSDAVDVSPYPVDWNEKRLEILHAYIAGIAHAMGIDLFDISWDRPHIQRNVP
jgi:hypothetical protein